jgi:hypothetical protein
MKDIISDQMNDKKRRELALKCERIRDEIIDNNIDDDTLLKKKIKKELNKKEIEELAMQFILQEALQSLIDKMSGEEEMSEQDKLMYG